MNPHAPAYRIECCSERRRRWHVRKSHWSRIVHRNGQVLYASEVYSRRGKMVQTASNLSAITGFPITYPERP